MPDDILSKLGAAAVPPTIAQLKAQFDAQFEQATLNFLTQIVKGREALHAWLWRTDDLTPGQKIAALGTRAKSTFVRDAAFKAAIEAQLATIPGLTDEQKKLPGVPDKYAVALNDDGTASVADAQ